MVPFASEIKVTHYLSQAAGARLPPDWPARFSQRIANGVADLAFPPPCRPDYNSGMGETRKATAWPWLVAALAGAYVGAYYLMAEHSPLMYKGPLVGDPPLIISLRPCYSARSPSGYVFGNDSNWGMIFAPIHSIDRRLRPNYWTLRVEPSTF